MQVIDLPRSSNRSVVGQSIGQPLGDRHPAPCAARPDGEAPTPPRPHPSASHGQPRARPTPAAASRRPMQPSLQRYQCIDSSRMAERIRIEHRQCCHNESGPGGSRREPQPRGRPRHRLSDDTGSRTARRRYRTYVLHLCLSAVVSGHAIAVRPVGGVDYPRTYQEFRAWFPDDVACREYLGQLRWPDGFICPRMRLRRRLAHR